MACRNNNFATFKEFSSLINNESQTKCTLRGLMDFKPEDGRNPIPIDEVESVESICRRFKTGAMSYGSISQEAHECLAIAMNRIGGKSNTGEGGEDPARFIPCENGDIEVKRHQTVASGRFGVNQQLPC
jgi:glutamate synthase (ferredoxin)